MTYTFEDLKADVKKEAEALRVHATGEEREMLRVEDLDPKHPERCCYGLMTGECDSGRASELIQKCTTVFLIYTHHENEVEVAEGFKKYKLSPIEHYIGLPNAKNANLIAYLRGETETLDL